jgi:hypothetical protein
MSDRPKMSLRRKLFLAGKATKAVEKGGHNNGGKFSYTKAEDIFAEASRVLEKQGILVLPTLSSAEFKMGKTGVLAIAEIEFEVCDTKTDETLTLKWQGTGFDFPGDKALYQAQTGAKKYFLQFLLDIRVDDEDDPEYDGPPVPSIADQLTQQIRTEQDQAAEQPDAPSPEPVLVGGIESEFPADTEGLG